jgi:hypothetical protein
LVTIEYATATVASRIRPLLVSAMIALQSSGEAANPSGQFNM